jgi:hypothetical protein
MARPAEAASAKKPLTVGRKPGRPKGAPGKTPAKIAKSDPTPKRVATASPAAPKLSKDELRARVEQLERANTTLLTKNRGANPAAKTAAASGSARLIRVTPCLRALRCGNLPLWTTEPRSWIVSGRTSKTEGFDAAAQPLK